MTASRGSCPVACCRGGQQSDRAVVRGDGAQDVAGDDGQDLDRGQAGLDLVKTGHDPGERGLAGPDRAGDRRQSATPKLEADAVQGGDVVAGVGEPHLVQDDQGGLRQRRARIGLAGVVGCGRGETADAIGLPRGEARLAGQGWRDELRCAARPLGGPTFWGTDYNPKP
jgi:hypothetical protein